MSVGIASDFSDVHRFMRFLHGFVDRTTEDIDLAGFTPGGHHLVSVRGAGQVAVPAKYVREHRVVNADHLPL